MRQLANGILLSGIISEVEAYLGAEDPACHAYQMRRTCRTEPLYLAGGHAYIYLVYGLHTCLNVVTRKRDIPEAVLLRALIPLDGILQMRAFRTQCKLECLSSGPGNLCQALQIDRSLSGHSLDESPLWIRPANKAEQKKISQNKLKVGPRIGIDYAGQAREWPLRFWLA